jgi:hypothetical protein
MKTRRGVNQPWADYTEIDEDFGEAEDEFGSGAMTFDELQSVVGPESAREIRARRYGDADDIADFFDDPERL